MLFSGIPFLYFFLPAVLILHRIVPKSLRNAVLLVASLLFYAYGEPVYTLLMLGMALSGYLHGLWIARARSARWKRIALTSSLVLGIGALGYFKYADFVIATVNSITGIGASLIKITLPIGISFYTFQTLSYTIDVYRDPSIAQKSFLKFGTYVTLFPQLIAGPIVRYTDVAGELDDRALSIDGFSCGIRRFVLGLAKNVLLANIFGEFCAAYTGATNNSVLFVWANAVAYTLQIYFDFSGYSDMAIGLGRMLGFHFPENFNYPYIARSITEFWRRWHMTLSQWFRDYVYIPLGGNRVKKWRWLLNILIVWGLTGLWHGASWTFVAWGLFYAVLLMCEKLFLGKWLEKWPAFFRHVYVLAAVVFGFLIFNAADFSTAAADIGRMFGAGGLPLSSVETMYYLRSFALVFLVGILAATPLAKRLCDKLRGYPAGSKLLLVLEPIVLIVLLLVCTGYLVDGSFNPFLYFRF